MWVSSSIYFNMFYIFYWFWFIFLFSFYLISVQYLRSFCSARLIWMYLVIFYEKVIDVIDHRLEKKYIDQNISSIANRFVSPEWSNTDCSGLESHVLICKHGGWGSKHQSWMRRRSCKRRTRGYGTWAKRCRQRFRRGPEGQTGRQLMVCADSVVCS